MIQTLRYSHQTSAHKNFVTGRCSFIPGWLHSGYQDTSESKQENGKEEAQKQFQIYQNSNITSVQEYVHFGGSARREEPSCSNCCSLVRCLYLPWCCWWATTEISTLWPALKSTKPTAHSSWAAGAKQGIGQGWSMEKIMLEGKGTRAGVTLLLRPLRSSGSTGWGHPTWHQHKVVSHKVGTAMQTEKIHRKAK